MKNVIASLGIALGLALGISGSALADRGQYRGYSPPPSQHYHEPARGYHRGYGWVAPVTALALTGIAAGLAASAYYGPPPVQGVAPQPVYVAPPRAYWNYCRSAGQYYPYVGHCPEPWQLVPAGP